MLNPKRAQWVSPYAHNAHFLEGDFNMVPGQLETALGPQASQISASPYP